jgi:predicted PolB exonuclease-like 3'-5' exonuclease
MDCKYDGHDGPRGCGAGPCLVILLQLVHRRYDRSVRCLVFIQLRGQGHAAPAVPGDGLPGKPDGISGAEVEKYYRDGHIHEIAEYCKGDVVNTYRLWLCHGLFRGKLSDNEFQASEAGLAASKSRTAARP